MIKKILRVIALIPITLLKILRYSNKVYHTATNDKDYINTKILINRDRFIHR